jgi:hypothetical protein
VQTAPSGRASFSISDFHDRVHTDRDSQHVSPHSRQMHMVSHFWLDLV